MISSSVLISNAVIKINLKILYFSFAFSYHVLFIDLKRESIMQ